MVSVKGVTASKTEPITPNLLNTAAGLRLTALALESSTEVSGRGLTRTEHLQKAVNRGPKPSTLIADGVPPIRPSIAAALAGSARQRRMTGLAPVLLHVTELARHGGQACKLAGRRNQMKIVVRLLSAVAVLS